MELYFLRHAEAVSQSTPGFSHDSERPLTPAGKKRLRRVVKGMKKLKLSFDAILTSPYVRARKTAEIVVKSLPTAPQLQLSTHLAAEGDADKLIHELQHQHRLKKSILLVGHEPYLSQLMSKLLVGSLDLAVNFKKAGLAKLTADSLEDGQCAVLDWLLTPGQLERMGEGGS